MFIKILDEFGETMVLSMSRIDTVEAREGAGCQIWLIPHDKESSKEIIISASDVEEVWDQIRQRL